MTQHDVWTENGLVRMANDNDSHYVQDFKSRNEINAFINRLIQARDEVFPKIQVSPIRWSLNTNPAITELFVRMGIHHRIVALETSTNQLFQIVHLAPDHESSINTYILLRLEKSYDPAAHTRVSSWEHVNTSSKILNLKAIADLLNQEIQPL